MAEEGLVLVEKSEGVVTLALNRPERKNAITGPLVASLSAILTDLHADTDVRAVVLSGTGGAFSSGLDLKEFNAAPPPAWLRQFQGSWRGLHEQLFNYDKPIVSALERYAINAGAALCLSADFIVAARGSFLQVGEVMQGRPAPMNLAWLSFRYGDAVARRITLLGRRIPATELETLGIAFEIVDDAAVLSRAQELARELAALPPAGMAITKQALRSLDLPGRPNSWFQAASDAVANASPGPLTSLKRPDTGAS